MIEVMGKKTILDNLILGFYYFSNTKFHREILLRIYPWILPYQIYKNFLKYNYIREYLVLKEIIENPYPHCKHRPRPAIFQNLQ